MDRGEFDPLAFASDLQVDAPRGVRLGPAIGAGIACVLIVLAAAVIPGLIKHPLGTASAAASPGAQAPAVPAGPNVPASSSYTLTYSAGLVVGPGAQCCTSSSGTWSPAVSGGFPDFNGPLRTSTDPNAWYEWSLGQPAGGHRWDQLKIRVWIPPSAGAWVRFTVTSTADPASSVTSYDVPEKEYQGWYELPATFVAGTPDRRTGSAWVRMTFLRPYTGAAADAGCAAGGCRDMAAAQVDFLWS